MTVPSEPVALRGSSRATGARVIVTGLVLLAVWWPARPGASDGFPLSSYPMFATARRPTSTIHTVLGVRPDGARVPLDPWTVGGTRQAKQALATAQHAVVQGRSAALCEQVAQRIAVAGWREPLVAIEVVTDTWDALDAASPDAEPRARRVEARCEVRR